ncbi:hypothetical protein [Sorangium sp. So ce204]|uniref:hypothetical protein n=1 Tax=Sorangium sp. So ce204 TaxID=3133288 RepID=UPI003F61A3EF
MSPTPDTPLSLMRLLRKELSALPTTHWRYLFPCGVAVWRYIHERHPDALGEVNAGYDEKPWFAGPGARWFVRVLQQGDDYQRICDSIMESLIEQLGPERLSRIDLEEDELPVIDSTLVAQLEELVEREVKLAIARGDLP